MGQLDTTAAPKISVIVPCFNAATTLPACLEALLAQDVEHGVEILVVDNNSTDATARVASETAGVTLLRESKQGAYAARNCGLRAARGAIMAFTDPDCVPHGNWLRLLTELLKNPEVRIAIGRSLLAGHSLALTTLQDYEHTKDGLILGGDEPELYYGHTNNMAMRCEVFEAIGPFEERRRGADTVMVRRTVDTWGCAAVRYVGEAEVVHLEIDNLVTYYRKIFIYGWSNAFYSRIVPAKIVPTARRWTFFRRVARDHRYGALRRVLLLGLMFVEGLCWRLGVRRGRRATVDELAT